MNRIVLLSVLTLAACDTAPVVNEQPTRSVHVMSRTWAVSQVSDQPVIWKAMRDFNDLDPYGPPAALRTIQAIRAIESATGCRVIRSSMYQNISGQFFSQVTCG